MSPTSVRFHLSAAAALLLCLSPFPSSLRAAPAFSVPGFVDEEIYKGNGMITLRFDSAGRLWVTEKYGRILIFEPNKSAASTFRYQYFEKEASAPDWSRMPDFSTLTPVESGTVPGFTLQPKKRSDSYAFRYTGTITIPKNGSHTFYLASDDGSLLYIDNKLVVDHEGLHGATEKSGTVELTAGPHEIRVEYFNNNGGQSLEVLYEGPDHPKGPVATGFFNAPKVFVDISKQVNNDGERGLLGLALDPDFDKNHFLYAFFSTDTDQKLMRFTANPDFSAPVPGSELLLLSGLPNKNPVHKAGDIAFNPKDPQSIYIMVGDDGDRDKVADLDNYWGKLLRIRSADGKGLPTNPYYDGKDDSVRSKIWSWGYRNPFRFAFDPAAPDPDVIYVSENGDGTDRLARVEKGAEGGWPREFEKSSADGKRVILQTSQPSKTAIAIVRNGPLGKNGPILYDARYGGEDRHEVRRWKLTGPKLDQLEELPEDQGKPFYQGYNNYNIVSFCLGPDGALYYTDSNQGDSKGNNYRLGRLRFVKGATPVANFSASATTGQVPLNVAFTDSSTNPDGDITSWEWDFGDGTKSTEKNPRHTYAKPGLYTATLTAANSLGLNSSRQVSVKAFYPTTLLLTGQISDARTKEPKPLSEDAVLKVYRQDGITPLPIEGGGGPERNTLTLLAGKPFYLFVPLQLTEPGVVFSINSGTDGEYQPALRGIPLTFAADKQSAEILISLSNTAIRGRILDTKLRPAPVELKLSEGNNPPDFPSRIVPDALGYYYLPLPEGLGSSTMTLESGGNAPAATHGRIKQNVQVYEDKTTVQNLIVGLFDGGSEKIDLSGIPETPNVDFERQVQPILTSSCVACHNGIATNTGGLDLQPGKAFQAMVNHSSTQAPGIMWVEPGHPERSYLFEKINSHQPQTGTIMRPGDPMKPDQQALIRDWIKQLNTGEKSP